MDEATREVLEDFGIIPASCPDGTVRVIPKAQYMFLKTPESLYFSDDPMNKEVIAYEIENEHQRGVGLVLRNFYPRDRGGRHLTIIPSGTQGPFWHNFTPALELTWKMGVAVLVEGPKDARVLFGYDVPAMAYLGAAPKKSHLRCIRRYAHSVIWIPDNDPVLTPEVEELRGAVIGDAKKYGISLYHVKIGVKDPGDLAKKPSEIHKIKQRVQEVSLTGGGGYVGG